MTVAWRAFTQSWLAVFRQVINLVVGEVRIMAVFGIVLKVDERQQSRPRDQKLAVTWLRGHFRSNEMDFTAQCFAESHNPTSINFMASVRTGMTEARRGVAILP